MTEFSKWNNKGIKYLKNEKYINSIYCFNKCLEIKSNDSNIWYNTAIAYRKFGRPEYARRCMEKTLEYNPKNQKARKELNQLNSKIRTSLMFGMHNDPIKEVEIEEKSIQARAEALLDVLRPFLRAMNSSIKILEIKKEKQNTYIRNRIKVNLSGDIGDLNMESMSLQADIQNSLEKLDPSISLTWVHFHYI
ncbi:MAG: tetratricopeptide repeat protein [Candidatus Lokiarchaeota archaeon]